MSGFRRTRAAYFLAAAILAGELSVAAADVLILRSVGPSAKRYPPGQRVPDNYEFVLRPGDAVNVLAVRGTRTFRGPGTFIAGRPASAQLASADGPRHGTGASRGGEAGPPRGPRRNTGAVRGDGSAVISRPNDIWHVDFAQGGRVCVAAGQRPTLWRAKTDTEIALTITPQTGASQTVTWARGENTLAWPSSLPVLDDTTYQLTLSGSERPIRLTTRMLPPVPADDIEALATAFIDKQCREQLDTLIALNPDPEEPEGKAQPDPEPGERG
jgi:hypothetical protein